jgi:hypothetical protein
MNLHKITLAVACVSALLASPTAARAQADSDRATARGLGQDGQKALDAKDFKTAEDDFRRADSLVHAPTLMLGLARALAGEGKYLEAQESYRRIIREGLPPQAPDAFVHALDDAKKEVDAVAAHIGGLTIKVNPSDGSSPPDLKVTLDDGAVSAASIGVKRYVDPGSHVIRATATGWKTFEMKVTVPDGGTIDLPVALEKDTTAPVAPVAAPAPAPSPTPAPTGDASQNQAPSSGGVSPWPWVAFGVGGAGLAVGIITGGIAAGKHGSLASGCPGGVCPPSQYDNLDSYHTMSLVSTVGFVVAGVGAAAGVTLLLLPKSDAAPPPAAAGLHVTPVIGPGALGAIGTF